MNQSEPAESSSGDDAEGNLNLFSLLSRLTLAEANNVRKELAWAFVRWVCIIGIPFAFNYYGNIFLPARLLAVLSLPILIYISSNPKNIFVVFGIGGVWGLLQKVFTDKGFGTEFGVVFHKYEEFLKSTYLVTSVALAIIAFVPLEDHFNAVLVALIGFAVFLALLWKWPNKFTGDLGKKTLYFISVKVIIVSLLVIFIPGYIWLEVTGWDPNSKHLKKVELYKLHKAESEVIDGDRAKEIARIREEKIEQRKPLTEAEKQIIREEDAKMGMVRPEKPRGVAQATKTARGQFTETITVLPGKRAYVPVREGYTAFYECDDWGNVEVPGSRMQPKGCGPRPSRSSDQWGKISGLVYTFTTASNHPLHVTVTQVPVKY